MTLTQIGYVTSIKIHHIWNTSLPKKKPQNTKTIKQTNQQTPVFKTNTKDF